MRARQICDNFDTRQLLVLCAQVTFINEATAMLVTEMQTFFWGGGGAVGKGECFENLINAEKRLDHLFFNVCVFSKTGALTEVTQRSSLRHFGPSSRERRLEKARSTENQYGCLSDRLNEL